MRHVYHLPPTPFSASVSETISDSMHRHGFVELLYVLSGKCSYSCDQTDTILEPGSLVLLFPYSQHTISALPDTNCQTATFLFHLDFVSDFKKRFCEYTMPDNILLHSQLSHATMTALQWLVNSVRESYDEDEVLLQKVRGWLTVVLGDIFYKRDLVQRREKIEPELLEQLTHYIETHLDQDFTKEQLAHALGISQSYLTHTLKHVLSLSYNKFIISLRLKYTEKMLLTTDYSLIFIAMECGFSSVQSFSRSYKKATGYTPNQVRRARNKSIEKGDH